MFRRKMLPRNETVVPTMSHPSRSLSQYCQPRQPHISQITKRFCTAEYQLIAAVFLWIIVLDDVTMSDLACISQSFEV